MTVTTPTDRPQRRRRRLPVGFEIVLAIVVVALVQTFLVKPFGVPSQSMELTLRIGDRIIVNRLDDTVQRGDVVVFSHGASWEESRLPPAGNALTSAVRGLGDLTGIGPSNRAYTVKRIIGMPGDRVQCCDEQGRLVVNGESLTEDYVYQDHQFRSPELTCDSTPRSSRCFPEIRVPSDRLLVLGDHRSQSADSVVNCRGGTEADGCARFVPINRVVGPVVLRIWPLSELGGIERG